MNNKIIKLVGHICGLEEDSLPAKYKNITMTKPIFETIGLGINPNMPYEYDCCFNSELLISKVIEDKSPTNLDQSVLDLIKVLPPIKQSPFILSVHVNIFKFESLNTKIL